MAQARTPPAFTAPVQLATVTPLSAKVMVPVGVIGVRVPVSDAVKVTTVFSALGLAGAGGVAAKLTVVDSAVIVYGRAAEVAVLKFVSPE